MMPRVPASLSTSSYESSPTCWRGCEHSNMPCEAGIVSSPRFLPIPPTPWRKWHEAARPTCERSPSDWKTKHDRSDIPRRPVDPRAFHPRRSTGTDRVLPLVESGEVLPFVGLGPAQATHSEYPRTRSLSLFPKTRAVSGPGNRRNGASAPSRLAALTGRGSGVALRRAQVRR